MTSVFELQRELYTAALGSLQELAAGGISAAPGLMVVTFTFGMLHALLPGHGKAVLASFYVADGNWRGAVAASAILIVTHVGSAIVLVLSGFALLRRTIGGGGRSPELETLSALLIVLIGIWLLWRAVRADEHDHARSGPFLAFVTGLVPCPLTTFMMTYAAGKGVIGSDLALSGAFATGMIVTVAAFPVVAVLLRRRVLEITAKLGKWRAQAAQLLETGAAVAIILLGVSSLVRS